MVAEIVQLAVECRDSPIGQRTRAGQGIEEPEPFEQAAAVVPRDPLERREPDVLEPHPGPATMDLLGLEQPDHGLGQR